jgi:tubulin polyglutamylase TTLL4
MDELTSLFDSVPLPYSYIELPLVTAPAIVRDSPLFFYVNRVITTLSRQAFLHAGIAESTSFSKWNFSWGRQYEARDYSRCKAWQKINHFAGAFLMGRKDGLHDRMKELKERFGHPVPFYPESYCLPKDRASFEEAFPTCPLWILKPAASARGSGIRLIPSTRRRPRAAGIYQVYISRPFLITGRKFDLRLYVLVTSISPLRIYMHENGMARFAVHQYKDEVSAADLKANLTNFSLNGEDAGFVRSESGQETVANSKWSLDFFLDYLAGSGVDVVALMRDLEYVTISTVIAGVCAIREHHRKYIAHRHTSYEMYGIDILLDENLRSYVMEINISPGMDGSDSLLDQRLKEPLMNDLLRMARFVDCDCQSADPCPGIELVDRAWRSSVSAGRKAKVVADGEDPWLNPVFSDFVSIRDFIEEKELDTGFRRVYPKRNTMRLFDEHFDEMEYRDLVFQAWIAKLPEERLRVVKRSFSSYGSEMAKIKGKLEQPPKDSVVAASSEQSPDVNEG